MNATDFVAALVAARDGERALIAAWLRRRAKALYALSSPEADLSAMALDAAALDLEKAGDLG